MANIHIKHIRFIKEIVQNPNAPSDGMPIYALCNDGTLLALKSSKNNNWSPGEELYGFDWIKIPAIPQD